jgi:hypothetical protein
MAALMAAEAAITAVAAIAAEKASVRVAMMTSVTK